MECKLIYEVDGNMGQILKVYEDKCVICVKKGFKAILFGKILNPKEKTISYDEIKNIRYKLIDKTSGYIYFQTEEWWKAKRETFSENYSSENSFTFSATVGTNKLKRLNEEVVEALHYIKDNSIFKK